MGRIPGHSEGVGGINVNAATSSSTPSHDLERSASIFTHMPRQLKIDARIAFIN
jgi:hypothetical protein